MNCPVRIIKLGTARRKGKGAPHEILFAGGGGVETDMIKLISERLGRCSVGSAGSEQDITVSLCETVMRFSVQLITELFEFPWRR